MESILDENSRHICAVYNGKILFKQALAKYGDAVAFCGINNALRKLLRLCACRCCYKSAQAAHADYGISLADEQIVAVALSQVGNVGGESYWRWYGFTSRVEWCACFVSCCANECGYIETGVVPKYAGCFNGVSWLQDRDIWVDGSAEPVAGLIAFFNWDDENGQDG